MHRRALILSAIAPAVLAGRVQAQSHWPTKTVHLVVPAPAGSSLDIIARQLGDKLGVRWGQAVVVDNRPGAGGMMGTDVAAKAAPDGHTLVLSFNGPIAFAPYLYRKVPYNAARDLLPVVMTTSQPNVLAIHAELPPKTLPEFIAWAKAKNGAMNYASLGIGSSAHLTMELFLAEIGAKAAHIPFNGSPPAALAVAQGEVDAVFMVVPALMAHVRNHKVRLLAVSSSQHPDSLKDLPTLASVGLKNIDSLAWNGLFAPAGTPEAVLLKINADVNAVLADPTVRTALDGQGLTPVGGSAADFRKVVEADSQRWGAVIQRLGLKLD
jgi:tripartite-type tricarboxylate transporter receptor subunit TctC